jgi:drug/metabolite transporter (DMT)-like permease
MASFGSIGYALTTSAAWGASNFLGGFSSRRANFFLLSTISHFAGLVCLFLVATGSHAPMPSQHAVRWSLVAGVAGGLALAILYGALSCGRMGLVSPVAAVLSVSIPVLVTIPREGSLGSLRLLGFAFAVLGVSLIGRTKDRTDRKALGMATLAGCGFAAYALAIKHAGAGSAMWIEAHSRLAALFVTAAITVGFRKVRDFHPRAGLWAAMAGLLDVSGSVAFVRASQLGRLDTVVVLSSLYPAVTALLAIVLLRERVSSWKAVGVCLAIIAVPLIASQ